MLTSQNPIGSGFGATSTAVDVLEGLDLANKVAIVTGGYSGIGLETARVLRSAGVKVIVPARDLQKAATALNAIDGVEIEPMDLMDLNSIDAFAEKFLASGHPLHILVNSAGIMASPLTRDSRRTRIAILHQPSRPLSTHSSSLARPAQGKRRARRLRILVGPSPLPHRLRGP